MFFRTIDFYEIKTIRGNVKMLRFRFVGLIIFTLLFFSAAYLSDPSTGIVEKLPFGAGFVAHLITLLLASSGTVLLFLVRKTFFDYPEADLQTLLRNAKNDERGAGLALIGTGLHMIAYAIVILAVLI